MGVWVRVCRLLLAVVLIFSLSSLSPLPLKGCFLCSGNLALLRMLNSSTDGPSFLPPYLSGADTSMCLCPASPHLSPRAILGGPLCSWPPSPSPVALSGTFPVTRSRSGCPCQGA